jgi:hypothetical protein
MTMKTQILKMFNDALAWQHLDAAKLVESLLQYYEEPGEQLTRAELIIRLKKEFNKKGNWKEMLKEIGYGDCIEDFFHLLITHFPEMFDKRFNVKIHKILKNNDIEAADLK